MKKKKTLHLSKKRKRKLNRISLSVKNIAKDFQLAVYNKKLGNKKQMFLTFFSRYYGIGFNKIVRHVLPFLGIGLNYKLKYFKRGHLNMRPIRSIVRRSLIKLLKLEDRKFANIQLKKKLLIYISYRHFLMLPVRGQRTKTHAKTRKIFHVL